MNLKNTTSSVAILALFDLLKEWRIPKDRISKTTGISEELIGQPDIRIPIIQMTKLWQLSIQVSGDEALGLHLREQYGRHFRHFVITIAKNSRTLLESAVLWSRYARLICEADRIDLKETDDSFHLVYTTLKPEHHSISMTEHDMAQSVVYAREFTAKAIKPREVRFIHTKPDYDKEYELIFRCPVLFNQKENVIILTKEDIQRPVMHQDPHLQAILRKHADSLMVSYEKMETVRSQVEVFIKQNLPSGLVTVDSTCSFLKMSRSTLHRRLKLEKTTFSDLLESIRKELVTSYIGQSLNTAQMSLLLGFTDPSSFQHAFRRWFDKSPGEYRSELFDA